MRLRLTAELHSQWNKKEKAMERRFYRSLLSLAIAASLLPLRGLANPTIIGDTSYWQGDGQEYNGVLVEKVYDPDVHVMEVKDYKIVGSPNLSGYNQLAIRSIISFGGGNGAHASDDSTQFYGDLHLKFIDSSITAHLKDWQWKGLYVRSDTADAIVTAQSNSAINITASSGDWIEGSAFYVEAKGEKTKAQVLLDAGSNINLSIDTSGSPLEANSAAQVYSEKGSAVVLAEKGTTITTNGYGVAGIKTKARDDSLVVHEGTIVNNSESGRGIVSHDFEGSRGKITIRNEADGIIEMTGINAMGIKAYGAGSSGIDLYNAGEITLTQGWDGIIQYSTSSGMYMQTHTDSQYSAENVIMRALNDGTITTSGDTSEGMRAESHIDSGLVSLANNGTIEINGTNSTGMMAMSSQRDGPAPGTAEIQILNSGTITLSETAGNSTGIKSNNAAELGTVAIQNDGEIIAAGSNSTGISAFATQNTEVLNTGSIVIADGSGITAQSRDGAAVVRNSGKISVSGAGVGIAVGSNGTQIIVLDSNTHVDAAKGLGGLLVSGGGNGQIAINQGASVTGGSADGYAIKYSGPGVTSRDATAPGFTLDNLGSVNAMSDLLFVAENATGSQITLNNFGDMTGYLRADGGNISVANHNTLNLRSFTDSDGDQQRDTKQVAMMQFGDGENSVSNLQGALIQLADVQGESQVDTTGEFTTQGSKSIVNAGINQGQMLNVNQFSNAGTLNLAVNQLAGDILAITGNASLAGHSVHDGGTVTSGGGNFSSEGGWLILDTVMNEGGSATQSDVLVVDNASKGSEATTIVINRVGGNGALTEQDGIQVVNVLGEASKDAFTLADSPLKAGAYEYTLEQGSLSNPANQSFYLRTNSQQINPDIGGYLANQAMATGLFMHSLHDRLGEPQYTQRYKGDERTVPGLWLRGVASNTKGDAAGRALSQDINSRVLHLGGDVTRWDSDNGDRYHLGLMGAWGKADATSRSKATGSSSRSKVDGYGVGAYLTWYNKAEQQEGWYGDLWGMYNWFNNTADSAKDYDSRSWVVSLESGHASTLKPFEQWRWMMEPQAQVSYAHYSTDSFTDKNGLKVGNDDANGVATRLGVRTYLQPTVPNDKAKFQPFLTVNWLWSDASNSMDFNGATFSSDMPKNRFEAKLGLQAEVRKDFHVYGQISGQVGENNYSHKAGQLGVRYNF
ncbi:autotransporter outer membrane beta-barrel domain-containing protein [Enterobacteriaceae bacterium 89]|nr:autotransporter outer membrane beta-barrel domain-containing protein [Enterobacteriaceae bacterium 89]